MDLTTLIVGAFITGVVTLAFGLLKSSITKSKEDLDKMKAEIVALQSTSVTDGHVRRIVKEELQPLSAQLTEVVSIVRNVEMYMAQDRGYRAGLAQKKIPDHNKNKEII